MESLSLRSKTTCFAGYVGGLKHQARGSEKSLFIGLLNHAGTELPQKLAKFTIMISIARI